MLYWFEGIFSLLLTPAPTSDVPFTAGLALGVGAAMDRTSPALSASVFRFGSGSLSGVSVSLVHYPAS